MNTPCRCGSTQLTPRRIDKENDLLSQAFHPYAVVCDMCLSTGPVIWCKEQIEGLGRAAEVWDTSFGIFAQGVASKLESLASRTNK